MQILWEIFALCTQYSTTTSLTSSIKNIFVINDSHILPSYICINIYIKHNPSCYHICQLSITFISHFSYRTYFYADHKRHYTSSQERQKQACIRKLFRLENINQNLCNHIFLDVGHKYMHTSCLIGTATQMSHVWEVEGGTTLYIHSFLTMKNDVDIDVLLLLLLFVVC